jgi:hypothetical protein
MKKKFAPFILTICFLANTAFAQTKEIKGILDNMNADAIKGTMTFLSDDLLEGRGPGTRGFLLASKYMETQFISLGLKPLVKNASYIQKVPLSRGVIDEAGCSFVLNANGKEEKLTYGREFTLSPYFASPTSEASAPLVFVGFGIYAPGFNYDDYRTIDVKGKIVVYMSGAPKQFPTSERAYYTTADAKNKEAIKRGAVGILSFGVPVGNRPATGNAANPAARRAPRPSYKWMSEQNVVANSYPQLKVFGTLNNQYLEKFFINTPANLQKIYELEKEGKSLSFPLNVTATIQTKTDAKPIESSNVVGYIEGSDPNLKNEYIVYSAHLDHLGIGAPVKGDSIYNGAHDDASGNAILLEVIKAYRSLHTAPKRSIIFASVTGEELGLLGSDYLANNFPIAGGKIVANLAIDMPFFFHPVLDIVPYGADHSSLGRQTERVAKELGLKISPDPFPEQVVFIRSDHYSFIKKGIPALFIKSGFMTVPSDTVNRAKTDVEWRTSPYHKPGDDMNQPFDFINGATVHAKVNFLIGYYVSMEQQSPSWNKGDFFGQLFARKDE